MYLYVYFFIVTELGHGCEYGAVPISRNQPQACLQYACNTAKRRSVRTLCIGCRCGLALFDADQSD